MKANIAQQLNRLNLDFYQSFAGEFSDSRSRLQEGIVRALDRMDTPSSILDLGCGDGRVGRFLGEGSWPSRYVGVDFASALLEEAELCTGGYRLLAADITEPGWKETLDLVPASFDAAVSFSVLHHIPSEERRRRFLEDLHILLKPGARCAISVWQCLHLERFRNKVMPWERADLCEEDVDPGDVLLDWQRGGSGMRYVHEFQENELVELCTDAGFTVMESWRSDGASGDLGLYVVLERS